MITIDRDYELEAQVKGKCIMLASYPRSGSHWTRRMVAEVMHRHYPHIDPRHGTQHHNQVGFITLPLNSKDRLNQCPWQFIATHSFDNIYTDTVIYLRRDFESVLRSTRRAEEQLGKEACWWGGDNIRQKWENHVSIGCTLADLVIDYNSTKADPAATVRAILDSAGFPYSESDIQAAVKAGSKSNMLKEQNELMAERKWDIVRPDEICA